MKNLLTAIFFLIFPLFMVAQNLGGLWYGTLTNDSSGRKQDFEMGLSEYRGKITGFTYTTFIENDTFYYSIKRIKGIRKDSFLIIEDVEMVANNFPERAAKKIKQTTVFPMIDDTTIDISKGKWSTNQTKRYYSLGGAAKVSEQTERKESAMMAHLDEMEVKTDIVIKSEKKKNEPVLARNNNNKNLQNNNTQKNNQPVATVTKPSGAEGLPKTQPPVQNNNSPSNSVAKTNTEKPGVVETKKPSGAEVLTKETKTETRTEAKIEPKTESVAVVNKPSVAEGLPKAQPVQNNNTITPQTTTNKPNNNPPAIATNNKPTNTNTNPVTQETKKPAQLDPAPEKKNPVVTEQKPVATAEVAKADPIEKKETPKPEKPADLPAVVKERKTENSQIVYFKSDSLILALYDNGVVDGDTVSVFLDGETLMSKTQLKVSATKKTIYIPSGKDSLQLVLFAENLGTIPPNTGLLTIRDGEELYQVRFSADLKQNATITLRRRQ